MFGETYEHDGREYECREGTGLGVKDGELCAVPPASCEAPGPDLPCASGICDPGPPNLACQQPQSYCRAASTECVRPDTPGVDAGITYYYNGRWYDCREGPGSRDRQRSVLQRLPP